jgi:hypothetical protein
MTISVGIDDLYWGLWYTIDFYNSSYVKPSKGLLLNINSFNLIRKYI